MKRQLTTVTLLLSIVVALSSTPLAAYAVTTPATGTATATATATATGPKGGIAEQPQGEAIGLIVRYAKGVNPTISGTVAGSTGVTVPLSVGNSLGDGWRTVEFAEPLSAEGARAAATQLAASPLVLEAHPNLMHYLTESAPVADAFVTTQTNTTWGLGRIDQASLPLDSSYTYDTTGAGVKAYIVDSGIRTTHTEFTGRVAAGYHLPSLSSTTDCAGHGTHVAGTIGGTTYGVAKKVTIVPVRVFDCEGGVSTEDINLSLDWILSDHQAGTPAVVNMSLGGSRDDFMDSKIQEVIDSGITVVVAAGNEGQNSCDVSPARLPDAITVNASTLIDDDAVYSNWGACSDLYAPGSDITSSWYNNDTETATISGTSMASPHVAGAVARVLSHYPTLTPAEVWDLLDAESLPFDPGLNAEIEANCEAFGLAAGCVGPDPEKLLYIGTLSTFSPAPVPTITGTTVVGETLDANTGSWKQTAPEPDVNPSLRFQWNRSAVAIDGATASSYTLTPEDVGHELSVTVTANAPSFSSTATTSDSTATVTAVLSAPSNLVVTAGPGSIGLVWDDPTQADGAIINYVIQYRWVNRSTYTTFADGVSASPTAMITGLRPTYSYYVRVAAETATGIGEYSPATLVKTLDAVVGAPTATSTISALNNVQLSWTAPTVDSAAGAIYDYLIRFRVTGTTRWLTFADEAGTATTVTVDSLTKAKSYDFSIQARTPYRLGTAAIVTGSTLNGVASAPTGLTTTATTATTLVLRWVAPSTTNGGVITDYIVRYRVAGTSTWSTFADGKRTATTATISRLVRNKSYDVEVKAVTLVGSTELTGAAVTARFATRR